MQPHSGGARRAAGYAKVSVLCTGACAVRSHELRTTPPPSPAVHTWVYPYRTASSRQDAHEQAQATAAQLRSLGYTPRVDDVT